LKIYKTIDEFSGIENAVVTTGTFDGVHLGHCKIISHLKQIALREKGETVVLTFTPHPRIVLFPEEKTLKLLNTEKEKAALLEKAGVDHLVVIPFTKEFSELSSIDFIRNILVNNIKTKKLVIGYDHHFGKNREGGFEHLKKYGTLYGFEVEEIPAKDINNVAISSTKIRKALIEGDISMANAFLGYEYSISGTVIKGNQLGRTIGFPTANIKVNDSYKLMPANGVYAVKIKVKNKIYKGMMNIGFRPTIGGKELTLEVNIFAFNTDIYNTEISIYFMDRIRNEVKFSDIEALKNQLEKDKEVALQLLS